MFERYTEKARRVIFFGRYEASEFGCEYIEADFLLLGIAREDPRICLRWLDTNYVELREGIARLYMREKQIAKSVDLPLSNPSKRVLAYAAEEAVRLGDRHIGTEHLFLGLLREDCAASEILRARGEDVKKVRVAISEEPREFEVKSTIKSATRGAFSLGLLMRLVTEDGSDVVVIPWHIRVPGIGEAIEIAEGEDGKTIYRILDLCWRMSGAEGYGLHVSEILLTVRKERG